MSSADGARVAVIGARGIGRHHGAWWTLEGARVCAFVGTSRETVETTRAALIEMFGFDGRGYTDVATMLEEEAPDIVDVCSPPAAHEAHIDAALDAGCHVLCEKPFVLNHGDSREHVMAAARRLVEKAEAAGRRIGVCTQYTSGAHLFLDWWKQARGNTDIASFFCELASPAKGRSADPIRVWTDLGPHPLSALQVAVADGAPDWATLDISFKGYNATARFDLLRPTGQRVPCEIVTRNAQEPPLNVRRFRFDDFEFDVAGAKGEDGVYLARVDTSAGQHDVPDFMRLLIRAFLEGRPVADGRDALRNLDWLLGVMEAAQ